VPGFHLLPETRVVAVCAARRDHAAAVAAEYGISTATADYRDLLRDPAIDAVSIAAPPHLHHQISIAAAMAGKHILCEKPLARTVAGRATCRVRPRRLRPTWSITSSAICRPAKQLVAEGQVKCARS
jgi:predicted dehydrogenase